MVRSLVFFAGLSNVVLPRTVTGGERYADKYVITSDRDRIRRLIEPFGHAIGSIEADYLLLEAPGVVYRQDERKGEASEVREFLEEKMIADLLVVQKLFLSLWLTKDNAATLDNAWVFASEGTQFNAHTNNWAVRPSCSDGRFGRVNFSIEEFRHARTAFDLDASSQNYLSGKSDPTLLIAKSLRFQRFIYLIGGARSAVDVAIKLALYCSALEAFVSTSATELSHQVSERVASLLSRPGADRVEIFSLIKEAYGYRSKAVHGAAFKGAAFERLREISVKIDDVCRQLSNLYLNDGNGMADFIEGGDEKLSAYFLGLILGHE